MIEQLSSPDGYEELIRSLIRDPALLVPGIGDPDRVGDYLRYAAGRPDRLVLGFRQGGAPAGLFVLLVSEEDSYLELLLCLTHSGEALEELSLFLEAGFAGWQLDAVFHPDHRLLRELLAGRGARFEKEQLKMARSGPAPDVPAPDVRQLDAADRDAYLAMHSRDVYWTGEKVLEAPDRFIVLIARDGDEAAGYLDLTCCFDENEPYGLFVRERSRGKGLGRQLLAAALKLNRGRGMTLLVDTDNVPAIRLYESMGFSEVPGRRSVTAHWSL